jgi:hypothetical protein
MMNKNYSKLFLYPLWIISLVAIFGTITMYLWNALLPTIAGLPIINWFQAVGLLILCRILFGGIEHGFRGGVFLNRKNLFHDRWNAMSDEERNTLAEQIKKRHGFDFHGEHWHHSDTVDKEHTAKKD